MNVPYRGVGLAGAILAVGVLAGPSGGVGEASSHVDAPHLIADPQMDSSDMFAHLCPDDPSMVCFVTDYTPAQYGDGHAFAHDARYELHVDQRGTGTPDITYRWTFQPLKNKVEQSYTLEELRPGKPAKTLVADAPVALSRKGSKEERARATRSLPGGAGRTVAARAADPFFSNAKVVGMSLTGLGIIPPIDLIEALNGDVNALVLQVPVKDLALRGDVARNPVIGIWSTASRRTMSVKAGAGNDYRQLARLGSPAVDVLTFFTMGDRLNTTRPSDDRADKPFVDFIRDPGGPKLISLLNFGVKAPPTPRLDLEQVYLSGIAKATGPIQDDLNAQVLNKDADPAAIIRADELRLNMAVPPARDPNRFGLLDGDPQGYPNGRRLGDDIHSIQLRMLLGEPAGVGARHVVDSQAKTITGPKEPVSGQFPYLPAPHPG